MFVFVAMLKKELEKEIGVPTALHELSQWPKDISVTDSVSVWIYCGTYMSFNFYLNSFLLAKYTVHHIVSADIQSRICMYIYILLKFPGLNNYFYQRNKKLYK